MNVETVMPPEEDLLAHLLPPPGFEDHVVVKTQGLLVWMKPEQVLPGELICFYDGDCRKVLLPTDPKIRQRFL